MLGVTQRPVVVDKMIVPPVRGDLKLMSIGFFLEENAPVMWRGPMLHRALEQFLSDVHWGELDTLVVDMPPGTGDVAISLGQLLPRAEVVVVTTPQPAAQQVAVRAAQMAQKTGMRLIGALENMSYLVGTGEELFGSGGGGELAAAIDAPLLGRIPLDPRLREQADLGEPLVWAEPENETARAIYEAAEAITEAAREPGTVKKPLPLVDLETRRAPEGALGVPDRAASSSRRGRAERSCPAQQACSRRALRTIVLPITVADRLPSRRAHRARTSPVARPSRWLPLSMTPERRAFDLRAAPFPGLHLSRGRRAPGPREPAVAGGLVQDGARRDDEIAREARLGARRGSTPDGVRDPERIAVLRARAAVRPRLIRGERCGDVRGLRMRLRGRSDSDEHEQAECCEPEEVLLTAHADRSPFAGSPGTIPREREDFACWE